MRACAVVPQKSLTAAKSRLGDVLRPQARAALSLAMLKRVCGSLRAISAVEQVIVMTPDPDVRAFAAAAGIRSVPDPCAGFNEALREVIRSLPTHSHAVLIIAADLPVLRPADLAAILTAGTPRTAVLAPSREGTGTNALLLPPATEVRPAFGPASLVLHRARARASGLGVVEIHRVGVAFDLDTPADLVSLTWLAEGSDGLRVDGRPPGMRCAAKGPPSRYGCDASVRLPSWIPRYRRT